MGLRVELRRVQQSPESHQREPVPEVHDLPSSANERSSRENRGHISAAVRATSCWSSVGSQTGERCHRPARGCDSLGYHCIPSHHTATESEKCKGLDACYSTTYIGQTCDQQRFTISEAAADWHEPMVLQRIIWPSIARANGQSDLQCSLQTHYHPNQPH